MISLQIVETVLASIVVNLFVPYRSSWLVANLKSFQHSIRAQANFIKHNFAFRYEYLFAARFKVLCVSLMAVSVEVETLLALFRFRA